MQAEGDVIRFPAAEPAPPDFAAFFADEHGCYIESPVSQGAGLPRRRHLLPSRARA